MQKVIRSKYWLFSIKLGVFEPTYFEYVAKKFKYLIFAESFVPTRWYNNFGNTQGQLKMKKIIRSKYWLYSIKLGVFLPTNFEYVAKKIKYLIFAENFAPTRWYNNFEGNSGPT